MGKKKCRARKGHKQSKDIIQEGRDEELEKKKKTRRGLRFSKTQWNEKALGQTHSKRDGRKSDDDQTASPVKWKEADGFKAHRPLHTPHAPTDDWGPQHPQSDVVVSEPQTAAKSFTATPGFQGSDQGGETPFNKTAGTTFNFQGYSNAGEFEFEAVLPVGLSRHEDADMGSGDTFRWQGDFKIIFELGLIELGYFEGTEPQAVELAAVQGNIGLCSSCLPGVMDKHIVPHLDVIGWAASPVGISDLTGLGCFERGAGGLNGFFVFLQKVRGLGGRLDRRRKRKSREHEGFSSVFKLKRRATCPDMDRCVVYKLKGRDKFRPSVMLGLNEATEGLLDCSIHAFC
uniref:Uncharacterized protein n=1 Tax=Chromera velia CCMP2878 TaxID=1169474 RepID=A0A0G4HGE1_9ALVE|eukprot:Cvel_6715.t1-p1 / transcript=Cvel_6715.t1 / gene=Cvel_6715 / organism=Chromera_velia_CCMP2878 / gene_product=hypothetical protein / transcript_product=hypothetical protein / location=Cvel_scaffold335:61976-63732(-) / protein_length=343 / sequence_SO=supercontig / SO=protein_coding / is_pseudo=false